MAYDRYTTTTPIVAPPAGTGVCYAKKGVMIVGGGSADVKLFKPAIYGVGITAGMGAGDPTQPAAEITTVYGQTAGAAIFPIGVHSLVRCDGGTTVYKLA